MKNLKKYLLKIFKISRPRFWFYLAGPFIVGFTAGASSLPDFNQPFFWIFLVYFLFVANVLLYGVNDIADAATDDLNEKKKSKEININNESTFFVTSLVVCSLLISLSLVPFLSGMGLAIFVVFLILSVFYSLPPVRFKGIPFLDFISNLLYILPGVIAYYQVSGKIPDLYVFLSISFWAFAMHLFSAIPDIIPDKNAKILTTPVYIGFRNSLWLCLFLWFFAWIFLLLSGVLGAYVYLFIIYPILPAVIIVNKKINISKVYWAYPYLNTILGFILFLISAKHILN